MESFKQLHQERQDLISQWESAVKAIQQRDQDIINAQDTYQGQKDQILQTQETLKEREEFLNQQLTMNTETEKRIGLCERAVSKLKYLIITKWNIFLIF